MSELLPPGVDVPMEAAPGASGGGHGSPEEASSEAERKVVELINAATVAASTSGLAIITILLFLYFKFLERRREVRFKQTHNQGLRQLFLKVSWDLCAQFGTADCVFFSL